MFSRFSRVAFPAVFIGIVATLVVAASCGLAYRVGVVEENRRQFIADYEVPDPYLERVAHTMDYVRNSTEHNDILFLGDSTCLHGIDVATVQALTGHSAFNIASVDWIGLTGMVLTFKEYLRHHPKPKLLVLCISDYAFSKKNSVPYQERFIWAYGEGDESTRPTHKRALTYYAREGIRKMHNDVMKWLQGDEWNHKKMAEYSSRYALLNIERRGGMPLFGSPKKVHPTYPVGVADEAAVEMAQLWSLCNDNDIRVLVLVMPNKFRSRRELPNESIDYFEGIKKVWPVVSVSPPMVLHFDEDLFYDNVHLNVDGALKLSKFLCPQLSDRLQP